MASLTCPHCGAAQALDDARHPASVVKATCRACHRAFDLDPATVSGAGALEVDWGEQPRHSPAVDAGPLVAPPAPSFRPKYEPVPPPPVNVRRLLLRYGLGATLGVLVLGRCGVAVLGRPAFLGLSYDVVGHSPRGAGRIIFFLHGYGGGASNSRGWIESFQAKLPPDTCFIVPDGPLSAGFGHSWFRSSAPKRQDVQDDFEQSRRKVIALIDELRGKSGIAPGKIYLSGFSQGAMLAVDVGVNYPDTLGGVFPIAPCSYEWFTPGKGRAPVRFRFLHGTADDVCSSGASGAMKQALEGEGHTVELVLHPGSHQVSAEVVNALFEFVR